MQAKFKTTISFTPDEISNILKEYVRKELDLIVDDVEFKVSSECYGYGPSEHYEHVFSGASLTSKARKPDMPGHKSSLASQIEAVESDPRQYGDH